MNNEQQTEEISYNKRSRSRSRSPVSGEYKRYMILQNLSKDINYQKAKTDLIKFLGPVIVPNQDEIVMKWHRQTHTLVAQLPNSIQCQNIVKKLNGQYLWGTRLKASVDKAELYRALKWNNSSSQNNSMYKPRKDLPPRYNKIEETYGLSINFLKQLDIIVLKKFIYVGNIDTSVTPERLREIFSNAGNIVNMNILNKNDICEAHIEYEHPLEAVQAISMFHNSELDGKYLIVRMNMSKRKTKQMGLTRVGPGLGLGGAPMRNVTLMTELTSFKETFTSELEALKNTVDQLKYNICQQYKLSSSQMQQTPMQNFTGAMNSNSFQNIPVGNPFPDQPMNNQNMMLMQANQGGMLGQNPEQINQFLGMVGHSADQFGQAVQSSMGFVNQFGSQSGLLAGTMGQMNPMTGTMGQMPGPMSQTTGTMGQMPGQMGQMSQTTGTMAPVPGQMGQTAGTMAPMPGQMGQTAGTMAPMPGQMGQTAGTMAQMPGQMGQTTGTVDQMTGHMGLFSQTTGTMSQATEKKGQINHNISDWAQVKNDKVNKPHHSSYKQDNFSAHQSNSSSKKSKSADMIMFRNLPPSVTEDILIGKLKEVGDLKLAELTGNGKAVVLFETERAASRCIDLFHNSRVDGNTIEVKYV